MRRSIYALLGAAVMSTVLVAGQPAATAAPTKPDKPAAEWYRVVVKTGDVHGGAGTEADVWLFLRGQKATFRVQMLNNGNFAFNKRVQFRYLAPDLGNLTQICVWRNNKGANPMWYLDYVMVYKGDTGTGGSAIFYQWIPASNWACKNAT